MAALCACVSLRMCWTCTYSHSNCICWICASQVFLVQENVWQDVIMWKLYNCATTTVWKCLLCAACSFWMLIHHEISDSTCSDPCLKLYPLALSRRRKKTHYTVCCQVLPLWLCTTYMYSFWNWEQRVKTFTLFFFHCFFFIVWFGDMKSVLSLVKKFPT